jgi:hypothetical protein
MQAPRPRAYLETTIVSYLAAQPSRDLITAAHQQVTRDWWESRRTAFDVFVSQFVAQECAAGDPAAALRRMAYLKGIPLLSITDDIRQTAHALTEGGLIPERYATDALHIAVAVVHRMDYLLTWNCKHIANAGLWKPIAAVCDRRGQSLPTICTPVELMGG